MGDKIEMGASAAPAPLKGSPHLRIGSLEPSRHHQLTARNEMRMFLLLFMLALALLVAALSRMADPVGAVLDFVQPLIGY
ncbi:MAG TPA: hypothetical protein PKH10_05065 [bacterium]|nr:hypothetical protein [bacterium]